MLPCWDMPLSEARSVRDSEARDLAAYSLSVFHDSGAGSMYAGKLKTGILLLIMSLLAVFH